MSGETGLPDGWESMTLTDLARFRTDGQEPERVPQSATGRRASYGGILAFDQALAKAGWAYLSCDGTDRRVILTGMCKTEPTDEKGFEDSFRRGVFLAQQIRQVMKGRGWPAIYGAPDLVVHEMPFVMGPKTPSKVREAGLVSSMAVRIVADECWFPCIMLNRQHVYKTLGLPPRASKREVSDYVRSIMPELAVNKPGPLNEDTYDAIALALVTAEGDWLSKTREGAK